jgi:hypothetical protein
MPNGVSKCSSFTLIANGLIVSFATTTCPSEANEQEHSTHEVTSGRSQMTGRRRCSSSRMNRANCQLCRVIGVRRTDTSDIFVCWSQMADNQSKFFVVPSRNHWYERVHSKRRVTKVRRFYWSTRIDQWRAEQKERKKYA